PMCRPSEHQASNIRTGDEQHNTRDAEKEKEHAIQIATFRPLALLPGLEDEPAFSKLLTIATPKPARLRRQFHILKNPGERAAHGSLGGFSRESWFESSE